MVGFYVRLLFMAAYYSQLAWRWWVFMGFLDRLRGRLVAVTAADGQLNTDGIYLAVKEQWAVLVAAYGDYHSDNVLTLAEMWNLMNLGIASLVKLAQQAGGANADKKAAVLKLAGDFYDDVVAPYDISFVPNIIEPLVDRFLKQVVMVFADGAIDAAVAMLKDNDMAE